jgi:hypothetical protein
MKTSIVRAVIATLVAPLSLLSQTGGKSFSKSGTSAAPFLEIAVGAPAVSMGGAFVSLANDATALYWNAAGTVGLQQSEVMLVHTNWIADTRYDFAALVLPLAGFGTLGLSFTSLSMDDMKVRTVEMQEGTGEYFSAGDIAAGISYARQLSDRFSIGFTAKYIQQRIWHETADAFALDVGTKFKTDLFGGLTIGAALSNFGTSMKMSGRDARQFTRIDPTKLGSSDQIPSDVELDSWDLPLLFQFGVSTTPLKSDEYRWTVAVDALHPTDDYESVNVGTEFSYHEVLFVRGGYQSLFLDGSEGGLCVGVGLATSMFFSDNAAVHFDYAFRDMGRLKNVQVASLRVLF